MKDEWKIVPKNAQENADYLTAAIQLGVTGGFMIDLSDELSEGDFVDSNGIAPTWTNLDHFISLKLSLGLGSSSN